MRTQITNALACTKYFLCFVSIGNSIFKFNGRFSRAVKRELHIGKSQGVSSDII